MKPRISVVIPAYNEEKYLPRCLEALQNLDFPKDAYEIIVVDNNSKDKTSEIAKKYGVKAVLFTKQQGVSATREFGVSHAAAEVIAFTDADITVSSNWLTKIDKIMKDEHILCVGGSVYPREANVLISFSFFFYDWILRLHQFYGKVLPWGSNMVVRKKTLQAIGGFDPDIPTSEDWDVSLRIQKKYGRNAAVYYPSLRVLTETRKQSDPKVFLLYIIRGIVGWWNFVILGKKKVGKMINIR
jgi:glycosyltransferase involved in cell wall biosynthesis